MKINVMVLGGARRMTWLNRERPARCVGVGVGETRDGKTGVGTKSLGRSKNWKKKREKTLQTFANVHKNTQNPLNHTSRHTRTFIGWNAYFDRFFKTKQGFGSFGIPMLLPTRRQEGLYLELFWSNWPGTWTFEKAGGSPLPAPSPCAPSPLPPPTI